MNEIERTIKDEQNNFELPLLAKLLVAILIFVFIKHYIDYDDLYYNDEPLVTKVVNVGELPEYIDGGKSGTDRYTFKSTDYNCRFWIAEGALDIMKNDDQLKSIIEGIRKDQKVSLDIYKKAEDKMNDPEFRALVIGLTLNNKVIISPDQVREADKRNRNINIIGAPIIITGILIALYWRKIKQIWD